MDIAVLKSFSPEIFFSICLLLHLVFNARLINLLNYNFPILEKESLVQVFVIIFSVLILYSYQEIEGFFFNFLFVNENSTTLIKSFVMLSLLFSIVFIWRSFKLENINFFEYFNILLFSVLSLLLLINSYDFISVYLIIEMQALCFYTLASFKRNSAFSSEASLKYFISGSFISGIFLFGTGIVYGLLGTLNINDLSLLFLFSFENENMKYILLIGVLAITITLFFKIGAAPFHFWVPDVYEGSPLASTILFSIVPKIAIFTFFIRWVNCIPILFVDLKFIFFLVAIISIFLGTFFALNQKRVKRLIIYSSIAQIGFLVAALGTATQDGVLAIYFFFVIYTITSVLIWSQVVLVYLSQKKTNEFYLSINDSFFISSLNGLFKINKLWAFSFVLIFFSVAGVPPLGGFLAKIFIIFSLLNFNQFITSIVIFLISAISVYYYVRIIKISFFESNTINSLNLQYQTTYENYSSGLDYLIIAFFLFLLIFFFFAPSFLLLVSTYVICS